jgi:hypothetical protein
MNIDELRELLRTDIVTVTFTKKDGSTREMVCTTMPDYMPPVSGNSVVSDSLVTVWDCENAGWRSFKFDSIQSVDTEYFNYVVGS